MNWKFYFVGILVLISAGYMTFDGVRAFAVGDYLTQKTGPHAGQLGPWSKVIQAIGLDPRSSIVKSIFVLQGVVTLALLACYLSRLPWAKNALKITAIAGLWYLPVGTLLNAITLVLLFI